MEWHLETVATAIAAATTAAVATATATAAVATATATAAAATVAVARDLRIFKVCLITPMELLITHFSRGPI